MTVPRINALVAYWNEECPPAAKAMAAFIGFKPKKKKEDQPANNEDDVAEFLAMFPMAPSTNR